MSNLIVTEPQLLPTKLYRPRLPPAMVERNRLLQYLDDVATAALTLVSAPAGYGKSVLISHWVEANGKPAVWLSLDERDSDLRTFLRYLFAALDSSRKDSVAHSAALLGAPVLPPVDEFAACLLGDLESSERPWLIVLDDYHSLAATSPVHALLTRCLAYPLPGVRWLLLSRQDPPLPLAALRARGELLELRCADLQFNDEETCQFLRLAAGTDAISAPRLVQLSQELEGWVAGLRLLALVLAHMHKPDDMLPQLSGGLATIQDYLQQEVLERQPEPMRQWLLLSAVTERFSVGLLDALWDGDAPASLSGQGFIEQLRRDNLFVIALDEYGQWYRYHHLFRELLLEQRVRHHDKLPCTERELQLRASQWFENNGLISEALDYALAALDTERAVRLVTESVQEMIASGQWAVLIQRLERLPEEVIQQQPLLLLARAFKHYYHMEPAALPPLLDRIEVLMARSSPESLALAGEVVVFRAFCAMMAGNSAHALTLLETAVNDAALKQRPSGVLAELLLALSAQMEGQGSRIRPILYGLLSLDLQRFPIREVNLAHALLFTAYIAGEPAGTAPLLARARHIADATPLRNLQPWNDYVEGLFHLQHGDLDSATRLFDAAGEKRYFHHVRGAADAMCALTITSQLLGQPARAKAMLNSLEAFIGERQPALSPLAQSCAARLAVLRGDHTDVTHWLRTADYSAPGAMLFWFELPAISWCRALIASGSNASLDEASRRLLELEHTCQTQHNQSHLIEVLCLHTLVLARQGQPEPALATLERALILAEPGGYLFAWLELARELAPLLRQVDHRQLPFAQRILTSIGVDTKPAAANDRPCCCDSLTRRELDVLVQLAARLRDKEIAQKLDITPQTVKFHLKNIYQKLAVSGRLQAVKRARELSCLPPAERC